MASRLSYDIDAPSFSLLPRVAPGLTASRNPDVRDDAGLARIPGGRQFESSDESVCVPTSLVSLRVSVPALLCFAFAYVARSSLTLTGGINKALCFTLLARVCPASAPCAKPPSYASAFSIRFRSRKCQSLVMRGFGTDRGSREFSRSSFSSRMADRIAGSVFLLFSVGGYGSKREIPHVGVKYGSSLDVCSG